MSYLKFPTASIFFLKFSELHAPMIQISHKINLISSLEIAVTKKENPLQYAVQSTDLNFILSSSNIEWLFFSLSL